MQPSKMQTNLPPGFIIVPSLSRPGKVAYWSQSLGQKFSSVELAWIAHDRLISSSRDKDSLVKADVERIAPVSSPEKLTSLGPQRVGWARSATVKTLQLDPPPEPYTDALFPPNPSSIGSTHSEDPSSRLRISSEDRDKAIWIRLPDYIRRVNNLPSSTPIELFGNIEPNDLTQGIVGDCWLLATLACLAEFPNAIESLFCGQSECSPDGKYTIKLFDLDSRVWEHVVIDDYIPCKLEDDYSGVPRTIRPDGVTVYASSPLPTKKLKPLFAVPNGNQMWASLLEKAMAKFVGTYAQIAGGHEPFAMIALTGFPQVYQFKRVPIDEAKTIAKKGEWERGWAQWAGKFSPSCGYRPILGEDRTMNPETFFQRLLEYDRMNYLLAASIVCYAPPNNPDDYIRQDGLVNGHAYSLLSVEEFGSIRLVKLRNPHGSGTPTHPTEWNGRWSDDSDEWKAHQAIADHVGHERIHDGIFWMEYSDFVSIFDKVLVLPYPMSEPRGALSSMRRAKIRASLRTAGANGRANAGMTMENLTHIDEVVTAIHLMSVRPYDPYLNAPDWVRSDPQTYNRWAHEKLGTTPNNETFRQ